MIYSFFISSFCKNTSVQKHNADYMRSIAGDEYIFNAADFPLDKSADLDDTLIVQKKLVLKIGCKVMVVLNMPKLNLVNGHIGTVIIEAFSTF